jgi:ABC-2 type transport system ATP-binding protein
VRGSSTAAVDIVSVSKRFRLYHEKAHSLKERVIHPKRNRYTELWALRDVSFEVEQGTTVGILGRNGSGKSTLLKCVSGILQPTEGYVAVRGTLAALLELGAGFQPELSGRDNVYLNAALLGVPTREVDRRFDEIVAFAELEPFIDNQVKFYSSGMYVRLGFAVAVNLDPDVLVVDEVLAVGDEAFQRKCLERIKQFQVEGRTILFVTHAADLVRQVCDRAVVLSGGRLLGEGTPGEAIRLFREHLLGPSEEPSPEPAPLARIDAPARPVRVSAVSLEHPGAGARPYLLPGEPLVVRCCYEADAHVPDVVFAIALHDQAGNLVYATDTEILGEHHDVVQGAGSFTFSFASVPLLDGTYLVSVGVRSRGGAVVYDWRDQQARFEVMNPGRATGMVALEVRVEHRPSPLAAVPVGE